MQDLTAPLSDRTQRTSVVDHPETASAQTVAAKLGVDPDVGLERTEAARRKAVDGPNEIEGEPRPSVARQLLTQFTSPMIAVLLAAAVVMLLIGEGRDTVVVVAIVVLNATIGFGQERRAERAMDALRSMTASTARVVRDGDLSIIPASEVVTGDVVLLEAGDVVPADARIVESATLAIDESVLSGESFPVDKVADSVDVGSADVGAPANLALKGTLVVRGRGRAVVVATGMDTRLGATAGLLKVHRAPATPLQRRLAVLGRRLAVGVIIVCAVVLAAGLLRGEDPGLMFLTAVSLAVAAVPEALPAVVTVSLAMGAQRMARRRALIRKLPAVETLGSVTVICTDKTGTLTQGRMAVEHVWTPDGEIDVAGVGYEPHGVVLSAGEPLGSVPHWLEPLLTVATLCNDAQLVPPDTPSGSWGIVGDPTEAALLVLAARIGVDTERLRAEHPRVGEVPFDADRRRMSTLHRDAQGGGLVTTKGGIESVVEATTSITTPTGIADLTSSHRTLIDEVTARYATAGYRVLALASRTAPPEVAPTDDPERDLTLHGLVAMADPPRTGVTEAVHACRSAGITPVMITGDHPVTASAIARRLGITDRHEVTTGADLAGWADGDVETNAQRIGVYARTSPEQKLDIVRAWQAAGHVVAMTGDGVNDAPALRAADIGVAMGAGGTDVAREAADMILEDDDFVTIVAAVEEGRRIYDNIRRFVRYTLTSNSGEIWVMLLGPFVGLPLPLLPAQILWVNLVTDGLPGLALAVERAERDVMRRPPRRPDESIFARGLWQHVAIVGLVMGLVPLAVGVWGAATGRPWQTMVFTTLVFLQLGHAMAVRSERESMRSLGLTSNRLLLASVGLAAALQLGLVYLPTAQALLSTQPLSLLELAVVTAASSVVALVVEVEKAVRRRHTTHDGRPLGSRDRTR